MRSTASMVEALPEIDFHIFTSDSDLKSKKPLDGVQVDSWQTVGRSKVFYASARSRHLWAILRMVRKVRPDFIYLNSYFAHRFTQQVLILRYLGLLGGIPIILAPHGEFSPGALNLKSWKKRSYIALARCARLYGGLIWHASSEPEVIDILRVQRRKVVVIKAPHFPPVPAENAVDRHSSKRAGRARLVFLSRISPKKNLLTAIQVLSQVRTPVLFDVYGPKEDIGYWRLCVEAARNLPNNISFQYCGVVDPKGGAERVFSRYDALFLPTLGENYGYVILEAWAAATPVLISDETPWKDLESMRSGWEYPLSDLTRFSKCIERLAAMGDAEHAEWRSGANNLSVALIRDDDLRGSYEQLFNNVLK